MAKGTSLTREEWKKWQALIQKANNADLDVMLEETEREARLSAQARKAGEEKTYKRHLKKVF